MGVLAVGSPPVSLEEGRGHGPGTEGMRVPQSSPGWGAVRWGVVSGFLLVQDPWEDSELSPSRPCKQQ